MMRLLCRLGPAALPGCGAFFLRRLGCGGKHGAYGWRREGFEFVGQRVVT
jgi:hypothetical protein